MIAWLLVACGPRLECGEGTFELNKACLVEGAPLLCGEGTFEDNGQCVPDGTNPNGAVTLRLPAPVGTDMLVSQGFHGGFSHNNYEVYAVDFAMDTGSLVVAAHEGIVIAARADSTTGCGDPSCAADANFITIDHGDGLRASYFHLDTGGVLVEVGDTVGRGQPIGRSGNTGFSTGPHLHLVVSDPLGYSVPIRFEEFEGSSDGAPYTLAEAASQNVEQPPPSNLQPSVCPPDTFSHRGIELLSAFPCSMTPVDEEIVLRARLAPSNHLALHRYSTIQQTWRTRCVQANEDGIAEMSMRYNSAVFAETTFVMLSSHPVELPDCEVLYSWDSGPRITLTE